MLLGSCPYLMIPAVSNCVGPSSVLHVSSSSSIATACGNKWATFDQTLQALYTQTINGDDEKS